MPSVTVTPDSKATVNESRTPKRTIELATLADWKAKASPLFQEHYDEIARNKNVMVLNVNWPLYESLAEANSLFVHLAMQDGVCIGYSMNFVSYHFHYADLKVTQNDVLFVKKEFRSGRLGLSLIKATEEHAKSIGCKLMLWHAKENTALEKLLPRLKYGVQEIIYSKEI